MLRQGYHPDEAIMVLARARRDFDQRADDLIEQVMLVMANGKDWLRHRVSICERL